MKKVLLIIMCSLFLCACTHTMSLQTSTSFSPIIDNDGADPWIMQWKDEYFYTKTTGNNVTIWRSKQLSSVAFGESKVVWEIPKEFESAWAPELHYLDNKWIVYVALNKSGETHRMYALVNTASNPFEGNWVLEPVKGMDDKFAIDGTIFQIQGKMYFLWSGWEGYENVSQHLYIAPMTTPTEVGSKRILLSRPEFSWEKKQSPWVNEGPEVVIIGDTINLLYSASGSWDDDYCLGLLTINVHDNPLDSSKWKKYSKPILSKTDTVFGPGHNGIIRDKGGQLWLAYHASHAGWNRSIRLQPLSLENGIVSSMTPVEATAQLALPDGDMERHVLLAKDAQKNGELQDIETSDLSGGVSVRGFSDTEENLEFSFDMMETGEYHLLLYVRTVENYSADRVPSVVTVNDREYPLSIVPADYYQPIGITTSLQKGRNTVRFRLEVGLEEVDVNRLEVIAIKE